jgi:predicted S18 family serine protease
MEKIWNVFLLLTVLIFIFAGFQFFAMVEKATLEQMKPPNLKSTAIQLVAVDEEGNGLLIPMKVEVKPGDGKILVNIDNPSFIVDTQESMRIAAKEASRVTGYDLNSVDVLFSLKTNISIVGGPSAGAAMAAAVVSVLTDKKLNNSVIITGTIENNGYVGAVGAIIKKAETAKKAGAELFLVPEGQSVVIEPVEECAEKKGPGWVRRECKIKQESKNVSEIAGVEVKEVITLDDALKYLVVT